jgi:hypothetical protein
MEIQKKMREIEIEIEIERKRCFVFDFVMKRMCREVDVLTIEKASEDNVSGRSPGFNLHVNLR